MKRTPIRGIVVAGNSLEEAQELYRAVATGQDVQALHDESESFVVLSSASSDINILNPLTGSDDLTVGDGLTENMEFLSSSSDAVDVNYTICTAGCDAHILADDAELMHFCPACASALEDMSEEEIAAHAASLGDDDDCSECGESIVACAATQEEAVAAYQALIMGETAPASVVRSGDTMISMAGANQYDVYSGDTAKAVDFAPTIMESLSSSSDDIEAHHFVCASSSCESPHVISSDDMPIFCPSCSSGLLDPEEEEEATAASDEDEDDYEEDEDESDLDEDDEEATAGSDDDSDEDEDDSDEEESDEEEDDSDSDEEDDESDLDEEDEDDSDEDEDDEEDEAGLTLSVSSVQSTRARTRRQEAVAASKKGAEEQEEATANTAPEMVAVKASFLAVAGSERDHTKLDVAYAANLHGENTWIAFYDGIPFAKAVASATTKHAEIFNSEVFGRAFKAQAAEHGIDTALAQMEFAEIKPEIQVADYVQSEIDSQVQKQIEEVTASAKRDRTELNDRFAAALALAATGISKGFFKGKVNPIQHQLIESLSAVGIDNASALVGKAFAQSSDPYHKMLLAQACNIMEYNLDTQNQIAQAINDTNGVEEANASSAPVTLGRPVQVEKKQDSQVAVASTQTTDFNSLLSTALAGLGKR